MAVVAGINDDDTVNLSVWDRFGLQFPVSRIPVEENADEHVHFFRPDGMSLLIPQQPIIARNPQWPRLRNSYLAIHPLCEFCGRAAEEVHHVVPVSADPTLELVETNLFSLCHEHHFDIGHLGRWVAWNPCVVEDCRRYRLMKLDRPTTPEGAFAFVEKYGIEAKEKAA
ncbi:HNH endonuclease [Trichococcus shcherbakoviae]|uniref:HNH endonuclease n=1 Tax=Trichococcus shcherbakoviae TaxID=2094020 RepID=UPI002AA72AFD|nr:HNH endonuclease [Trichococcus shcherbakoviae]